jgi:predicted nucleic acid-binding protein
MSRIFWDTNLFIYLLEEHGGLTRQVKELARRMLRRGDQLFTSALTVGELLVKPLEQGDHARARLFRQVLERRAHIIAFDLKAADHYALIRKDRTIRAPDAIQLACAARVECDLFITNDDHLSKKAVPGIQFVVALKDAPI